MEKPKDTNKVKLSSRRKFLSTAALSAPVLTMMSKPAFGAICNISGFVSATPTNVSGVARHTVEGCGGFSHGAWKNPDQGNGRGDGNRGHWYIAGIAPNPRGTGNATYSTDPGEPILADPQIPSEDPPATYFGAVFTHDTSDRTFEDVINENGSFDQFAAQTLMNALYFGWGAEGGNIIPADIIALHEAVVFGSSTFTNTAGDVIDISNIDVKEFFENTQH